MAEQKFKMPNENFAESQYAEAPSQQVMQNQDEGQPSHQEQAALAPREADTTQENTKDQQMAKSDQDSH